MKRVNEHNKLKKDEKYKIKRAARAGAAFGLAGGLIISHIITMVGDWITNHINPEEHDIDFPPGVSRDMEEEKADFEKGDSWKPSGSNGKYQIVDISSFQGDVDIKTMKANGVDGIIIKLFDAYYMDYPNDMLYELDDQEYGRKVEDLIRLCEENDMPYGFYVFSRATTEEMAQQEAVKTLKFLSRFKARPTLPIYYDIEPFDQPLLKPDFQYGISGSESYVDAREFFRQHPDRVIANFKAFADVLEAQGYFVGIYSNLECGFKVIDPTGELLADYALWISYYPSMTDIYGFEEVEANPSLAEPWPDDYGRDVGLYQFTETGHVEGVYEGGSLDSLDMSYMYYNYVKIICDGGYNKPMDYSIFENPDFHYTDLIPNKNTKNK